MKSLYKKAKNSFRTHIMFWLMISLLFCVIVSFWLGHDPEEKLVESFRNLSGNLTAELIGAMIGVFVIDQLLKLHSQQNKRALRALLILKTHTVSQRTCVDLIEAIHLANKTGEDTKYEPVDGIAFYEFTSLYVNKDYLDAKEKLSSVFRGYYPINQVEAIDKLVSSSQLLLDEWKDILNVYNQHYEPEEIAKIMMLTEWLQCFYRDSKSVLHNVKNVADAHDQGKSIKDTKLIAELTINLMLGMS